MTHTEATELIAPAEIRELTAWFRKERAKHAAAPRPAEARRRLVAVAEAAEAYAMALAELGRHEAELAGLTDDAVADLADEAEGDAVRFRGAVADLDARGARLGGDRRVTDLFVPPPRYRLAAEIADRLDARGVRLGASASGALADAVSQVLAQAGGVDPERGLEDLLKSMLAARRSGENIPDLAGVGPSRRSAA
jgi:hypothetical protein